MAKRILSAAVAIPLFLIVVYILPSVFFKIAISVVCAIMAYELTWRSGIVKLPLLAVISCAFSVIIPFFMADPRLNPYIFLLAFLAVVIMFVIWLMNPSRASLVVVLTSLFSAIMLPALLSALLLIFQMENGKILVLIPFLAAWMTDTGAYFTGVFFGRHKLAEKISPKKTIEGSIGGIVVCILSFLVFGRIAGSSLDISVNYLGLALAALVLSLIAQIGDLSFSIIKREYNIKDYGVIFPGHGGILDRFDSVMFTVPAAFILLRLIGGII